MLNRFLPFFLISNLFVVCAFAVENPLPNKQVGDIARQPDGRARFMTQYQATEYCASQGQRLPSIRELAQLAQSLGNAGISETPSDGYYQVNARNSDGKTDSFYYSNAGYLRPTGEWHRGFWSSSVDPDNYRWAFFLDGKNGGIYRISSGHPYFAVRCARS